MNKGVWIGTHNGMKQGKSFPTPAAKGDDKAWHMLDRRRHQHAEDVKKLGEGSKRAMSLSLNPPGSLNKRNH